MSQIQGLSSYSKCANGCLESYVGVRPMGDWSSIVGSLATEALGSVLGGGGGSQQPAVTIVNTPPPQPAPPVPFNWTPVIISGAVVLITLTLIMTTTKK